MFKKPLSLLKTVNASIYMSYQITIKNSVHKKLEELKGNGSYSDIIESMMNKLGIASSQPGKTQDDAARNIPVNGVCKQ